MPKTLQFPNYITQPSSPRTQSQLPLVYLRYRPSKQRLVKMEDQLRLLTAGQTGFHIMNTPNPPPPAGESVGLTALKKPNIAVCAESQAPLPPNLATQDHLPASQPT